MADERKVNEFIARAKALLAAYPTVPGDERVARGVKQQLATGIIQLGHAITNFERTPRTVQGDLLVELDELMRELDRRLEVYRGAPPATGPVPEMDLDERVHDWIARTQHFLRQNPLPITPQVRDRIMADYATLRRTYLDDMQYNLDDAVASGQIQSATAQEAENLFTQLTERMRAAMLAAQAARAGRRKSRRGKKKGRKRTSRR